MHERLPRCPRARTAPRRLLALVAAGAGGALAGRGRARGATTGRVAEIATGHPSRSVEVIVRLAAGRTEAAGAPPCGRHRGRVTGDLHIFNGLAARLRAGRRRAPRSAIRAVAAVSR